MVGAVDSSVGVDVPVSRVTAAGEGKRCQSSYRLYRLNLVAMATTVGLLF